MFEKHKIDVSVLDNGSKLVYVKVDEIPFSIVSVWFQVGSRNDPIGKEGLAHFFEHLLGTKTPKYPERIERLRTLESKGIEFNAFTYFDTTHYYHIQLPGTTVESLQLLIDGIQNGIIDQSDIDREKDVILNEEARERSNPQRYIWRLKNLGLWPKSLLGRDFYGSKETIEAINLRDIEAFRKKYYNMQDATIVIIGDVDISACKNVLNLEPKSKSVQRQIHLPDNFDLPEPVLKRCVEVDQSFVGVYYRTMPFDSGGNENYAIDLLRQYLSNTWISKFVEQLRIINNYTYWVDGADDFFEDTGYIGFNFSVTEGNLNSALKIVNEEIGKVNKYGPIEKDFDAIKISYVSWLIKHTTANAQELLWWYGRYSVFNRAVMTLSEYVKKINELTTEDLKEVSSKYLRDENRSIVILGKS